MIGVLRSPDEFDAVEAAYRSAGYDVLQPIVTPPADTATVSERDA